jgi:chromosome segregation ATPase
LTQDETRLRSNIESLNRVNGQQDQVQQYARQLAAAETKLAALRDTQSDLRRKGAALQAELNALIEKIEF